ncbi:hypothetical protein BC332_15326 [Capsicum chinense]|nr:hypothetical protein BC332_15326 [Capsicum chinense]
MTVVKEPIKPAVNVEHASGNDFLTLDFKTRKVIEHIVKDKIKPNPPWFITVGKVKDKALSGKRLVLQQSIPGVVLNLKENLFTIVLANAATLLFRSSRSTTTKKRHAKSAKIQAQTMEQRALAAAALMESLRFLVETDIWNDSVEKMTKRLDMTCGTKVGIISDCTFHRA